jgi:hypothetical protein
MISRKFTLGLALAAALLASAPAFAASQVMCSPEQSSGAQQRRVVVTSSTAATQPVYVLNGQGCAVIAQADVGFFLAQGYTQGSPFANMLFTTGVLTGTTAVQMPSLPAGTYIREILVDNSTANAVTGGIDIGTTSGGADVVSALTCAANCLTFVADSGLLKRIFSKTATQSLFVVGHTSGNSANLNLTVVYGYF